MEGFYVKNQLWNCCSDTMFYVKVGVKKTKTKAGSLYNDIIWGDYKMEIIYRIYKFSISLKFLKILHSTINRSSGVRANFALGHLLRTQIYP